MQYVAFAIISDIMMINPNKMNMAGDYHHFMGNSDLTSFRREMDMNNRCCGGRAWCIQDVCGIICAIMTWLLILFAEFVVIFVILLPNPYPIYSYVNMVIFNLLAFLATASHMRAMFSDPVRFCFK